jgi:hypothetical protein
MKHGACPLLLSLMFVGVLVGPTVAQTNSARSNSACVGVDFADGDDPKAREALCLRELAKSASRNGNILTLRLDNGAVKNYRSKPEACNNDDAENCVDYRLVGYHASAGLFLIRAAGYEGHDCELVSARSGTATKIADVPHFAPDGSTFIVINGDITGERKYDLAIGSIATTPPSLTWHRAPNDDEEWQFHRWLDQRRVALRTTLQSEACPKGNCSAVLTRAGTGWALHQPPAK